MTVKEALFRVGRLEDEAKRAEERADALRESIGMITPAYDKPRVQGGQPNIEVAMIRLQEADAKAWEARAAATVYRDRVVELINLLDDIRWRDILMLRYIGSNENWDGIAACLHFSKRHTLRLHGQALYQFSTIMPAEWMK